MQTITKRSFMLDQDDIKEALADYINRVEMIEGEL